MPFTAIRLDAKELFGFEYRDRLRDFDGVTISSATIDISVMADSEAADGSPNDIADSPIVDGNGTKVSVMIEPSIVDVHYCIECTALCTDGQEITDCDDVWVRGACV